MPFVRRHPALAAEPAAGPAGPRNGVPVIVEKILFDQRKGAVVADAVAKTVALIVMNEIVVDVMAFSGPQVDRCVAPAAQFAIVHFKVWMHGGDAVRGWKFVVVVGTVPF